MIGFLSQPFRLKKTAKYPDASSWEWPLLLLSSVFFGLLVYLEYLVPRIPGLALAGYISWIGMACCLGIYAAGCFAEMVRYAWHGQGRVTLIILLTILGLLFLRIPRAESLSGEATQQVACFLNHLQHDADYGWRGTCMFGYPARGFIIHALPTILWGRSLPALQLGGSLYLIVGLIIFASGLLRWFQERRWADSMAALLLVSIIHFHYVIYFSFLFEQSIFPFCFSLMLAGLWLRYQSGSQRALSLVLSAGVAAFLLFSYTPGLAVYGLLLVVWGYLFFSPQTPVREKQVVLLLTVGLLLLGYQSLSLRHDINILTDRQPPSGSVVSDLFTATGQLLYQPTIPMYATPMVLGPLILFLGACWIGFLGWQYAVLAWWVVAVGVLSIISKGYTYYPIEFRVHRLMVAIPVVLAMGAFLLRRKPEGLSQRLVCGLVVVLSVTGGVYLNKELSRKPHEHLPLTYLLLQGRNQPVIASTPLTFIPPISGPYISLADTLTYFHPGITIQPWLDDDRNICHRERLATGIFVVRADHPCAWFFSGVTQQSTHYRYYGEITDYQQPVPWQVFERR